MKKALRIFGYFVGGVLLLIMVFVLVVWSCSPGAPEKMLDDNGRDIPNSISAIETVSIGGISQTVILRGEDVTKPVLLMLHGGPGLPEFFVMKKMGLNLEKEFVVAYWDQRGAGKSYSESIPKESMTLSQMVKDAEEITKYLQSRFSQEKIFLLGHSWGTLLGMELANLHPEYFHAYIGTGQISHPFYGEKVSLDWIRNTAEKADNLEDVEAINALVFPDSLASTQTWSKYLMAQRDFVNKYGGGMKHENLNMSYVFKTLLFETPEYTLQDKLNFFNGISFSIEHLWDDIIQTNFLQTIDSIAVPTHILQGVHDYQTPFQPAKLFFDQMKAPKKYFYRFENSAHSPFWDEPEKFNMILKKIATAQK